MRFFFAILVLMCGLYSLQAEIIPAERRITWEGRVGVPGGVPVRSTIFTNYSSGATRAQIQAGLTACPSNQVVLLGAGTYNLSEYLHIPTGVTLRGAGTNTIINLNGSSIDAGLSIGSDHSQGNIGVPPTGVLVSSGYTKGSTNLVFGSAATFTVGAMLILTEGHPSMVDKNGEEGDCCSDALQNGAKTNDLLRQTVLITSKSGNNVGFTPPLYWDYDAALSPKAYPMSCWTMAGIEDLKVVGKNAGFRTTIQLDQTVYCWVKNVESDNPDGDHVWLAYGFGNEVRDSFMHDGHIHTGGSTDDCIKLNWSTSGALIENNLITRTHVGIMLNWGSSGCVVAYNYMTNHWREGSAGVWMVADLTSSHSAHTMFNLFEGNIHAQLQQDSDHGSSSHDTYFRNWVTGVDFNQPSNTWETANQHCFRLDPNAFTNNIVGNLAGSSRFTSDGGQYLCISNAVTSKGEFTFGYSFVNNDFGYQYDGFARTIPFDSAILHGNYSFKNGTQQWATAIGDHTLPNSYYLSTRPVFFGNLTWPPLDPANPATATAMSIPAGYRFLTGTNPPAAGGTNAPPTIAISSPSSPFFTNGSSVPVTGVAADDIGVASVVITNTTIPRAFAVSGTTSWSATVTNAPGTNSITATATDTSNATATASIVIVYDTNSPVVSITVPTNNAPISTGTTTFSGTASDIESLASVRATNTTTSVAISLTGTTSWTGTATLAVGTNVLQVIATDAASNRSTNSVSVVYTPVAPPASFTIRSSTGNTVLQGNTR